MTNIINVNGAGFDTVWTFAYGMNMAPDAMTGAIAGTAGMLPGWRLEYRQYADVVPDPDGDVPGVLWQIPTRQLRRLDEREGYPTLYGRQLVDVWCAADDRMVAAWVYRMTERTVAEYEALGGCPISERYRQWMIEGRRAFGLPTGDIPEAVL